MTIREIDTGPRSISPKESGLIQVSLSSGRVTKDRADGTYFLHESGIFALRYRGEIELPTLFWCKELIGRDPNNYTLRVVRRGALLIQTLSGEVERAVEAHDIREVMQNHSGLTYVYDSGYLLSRGFRDSQRIGDRLMSAEEFQQVLLDAEQGIRPQSSFWNPTPFIKVDPGLAGQTLRRISFRQQTEPFWMEDAVVIDDNGQLVPRIIYHSLSPYRWGWDGFRAQKQGS